ncbi:MAG TPA: glutamate--tRNA ligase [Melioribacteraceae bacterium]|nr:glutamate--tRNA ligase [Melioribacteraceae bacterium]
MINETPRVRFAPSPTGYLHVGGLRTALYNYLFAKHNNGTFVLRIEDTDRTRLVQGAVENLIDTLKWAGLEYDEGPFIKGDFGPYIQSDRLDIYKKYVKELIDNNKAYYCFCSTERLEKIREEQQQLKLQPKYDKHCLCLSKEEIQNRIANGEPYVVRLNVLPDQLIRIEDVIRGTVEFNSNIVDDQVLLKSDGFPTYHLANVVDDHLMKITHVIRGEEWLSSTPKHVLLYDYFGWERPVFAHLPLLLNLDRKKLSKRQSDVAVEDFRDKGFLKEALVNFVALLGWTAGDDVEFYYLDELINKFSLERVNKSGAVFDLDKLTWLNAEHLRKKSNPEIIELIRKFNNSDNAAKGFNDEYLSKVVDCMRERISFIHELFEKAPFFFNEFDCYDQEVIQKRWKDDSGKLLSDFLTLIESKDTVNKQDFEDILHNVAENNNVGSARIIHPLRLAVSGIGIGPGLYDILDIIGKEKVIFRIKKALELIKK